MTFSAFRAEWRNSIGRGHRALWPAAVASLPDDKAAPILPVGPGRGYFEREYLHDRPNVTVLESSPHWREAMAGWAPKTWKIVPGSVEFRIGWLTTSARARWVMCSHVLEHLDPSSVYRALVGLDSCVMNGGALVLAGPYLWPHFYADLTHQRPYHPDVFVRYMCQISSDHSMPPVSQQYKVETFVRSWEDAVPERGGYAVDVSDDEATDKALWDARHAVKAVAADSWLMVLRKGENAQEE
jgi:hypothetical protein